MIQNISHAGLFLCKLLGTIFGALMLTFIVGEFPGQLSGLAASQLLLIILGGAMSIGLIMSLFKPLTGGLLASGAILGINSMAFAKGQGSFTFDFPIQFAIALLLVMFSLILKRGKGQES